MVKKGEEKRGGDEERRRVDVKHRTRLQKRNSSATQQLCMFLSN